MEHSLAQLSTNWNLRPVQRVCYKRDFDSNANTHSVCHTLTPTNGHKQIEIQIWARSQSCQEEFFAHIRINVKIKLPNGMYIPRCKGGLQATWALSAHAYDTSPSFRMLLFSLSLGCFQQIKNFGLFRKPIC